MTKSIKTNFNFFSTNFFNNMHKAILAAIIACGAFSFSVFAYGDGSSDDVDGECAVVDLQNQVEIGEVKGKDSDNDDKSQNKNDSDDKND
jgi:hypothetical protein